jgi:hypothetical protein
VNVTLFGNRVFTEVIKLKQNYTGLGQALMQLLECFKEETEHRDTGRSPWDDEGRNWSDVFTSKEHQRLLEKARKGKKGSSTRTFKERAYGPTRT